MSPQYILHARTYGVAVSAGLNGSATLQDATGKGRSFYRPINEWILPEKNLLTGLIFQPPGGALPDGTQAGGPDAYVHIELVLAGPDGMPDTSVPALGEFHWTGGELIAPLPIPILTPCSTTDGMVGTRLWQEAEVVTKLEDADKESIVGLVNDLVEALASQDDSRLVQLLDYRSDEDAIARKHDPAAIKASLVKLSRNFSQPKPPPPLAWQSALFTPAANGMAWRVQRGWMKPAILFKDDEMAFLIEVFASRIDGQWVISRG